MPKDADAGGTVRVLVVQDKLDDLVLLQTYVPRQTSNGAPAWELIVADRFSLADRLLEREAFDTVVLDIQLPDLPASEAFLAMRQKYPQMPVILLHGEGDDATVAKLLRLGAENILAREALGPDLFTGTVLHAIERAQLRLRLGQLDHALESQREEVNHLQLQLIRTEKLESIGRLAAGIAHEVKNPLGMLQMGVDYFSQRVDTEDSEAQSVLSSMRYAIQRADGIISDMVDFSRKERLEMAAADLNDILEQALDMMDRDFKSGRVILDLNLEESLPEVRMDAAKIRQVLVNLLQNAVQAMDGTGKLSVRTFYGRIDRVLRNEGERTLTHLRSGDRLVVAEITDDGPGIPPEKLAKIFDPFFTTKPAGAGVGLGLSVSKAIMDLHRGLLRVKNIKPHGVCAQIILKASAEENGLRI